MNPELDIQTSLVMVPAMVRTKAGELVFTLKADDFVLTNNGVRQKLTMEPQNGDAPLAIAVVLEVGGAGAREFEKYEPLPRMLEEHLVPRSFVSCLIQRAVHKVR